MCVAMPGRVVRLEGTRAQVDVSGNRIPVEMGLVEASVGDYVLVHAGCALEVMDPAQAEELMNLLREIEEASHA